MDIILNKSRQIYISRINSVQDYIENHMDEELCVDELADIAYFSKYHFQRIYRQITGESLYSYIKRLRLEKAVFLIRSNKNIKVQDVALSVGFSNQASLAKALKERYKISAGAIRDLNDFDAYKHFCEISMNGKADEMKMYYNIPVELTIRKTSPARVLYIRHTGSYKGNADLFMMLFTRLYGYASSKKLISPESKWFTVYHDYGDLTSEERLRLSVCVTVADEIQGSNEFSCMELAGGQYAVGRFLLKSDEYQSAWNYMLSKWLPESGYMPDDRLCYEHYPSQEYDTESKTVEIFIPIIPL